MKRYPVMRRGLAVLEKVAPPLAVAMAERMWFTPPRPNRAVAASDETALSTTTRITVQVGHDARPGFIVGEGPLVVLVHGWGGRAAHMLPLAHGLASAGFQAASIDLPGHGAGSTGRSDLFQMADGLSALIDHLGPPEAVVAHSLGAMAATVALTEDFPSSAVFLAPVLSVESSLQTFAKMAGFGEATVDGLRRWLQRFVGERWSEMEPRPERLLHGSEMLIIHDRTDGQTSFDTSAGVAAARPDTELVATDGLGHLRLLADADVIGTVTGFLAARTDPDRRVSSAERHPGPARS